MSCSRVIGDPKDGLSVERGVLDRSKTTEDRRDRVMRKKEREPGCPCVRRLLPTVNSELRGVYKNKIASSSQW